MEEARRAAMTEAAEKLRSRIYWAKYPKLAEIFQHRPPVNVYWHQLAELVRELGGDADRLPPLPEIRRYMFNMLSAEETGHTEHPQIEIRKVAPNAHDFEPVSITDCWMFSSERLPDPLPDFLTDVTDVAQRNGKR